MPNYAFRATDRMGNTVDGTVAAPSDALAANQIGQMGYSLVALEAVAAGDAAPGGMIASAAVGLTPPPQAPVDQGAAPMRTGGIDLTQPIAAMPMPAAPLAGTGTESGDPNATAEMRPAGALQPWERGGPVPQTPAPQMTMSATGSVLGRAQPVGAGAAQPPGGPPSVYQPGPRAETPRGAERAPYGAKAVVAQKPLVRRFMEIIVYPIFSGVVVKDLAPFYRQFATLVSAGLPIYQALVALEGNTTNAKLKEVARAGQLQVQSGGKFSDVLAAWPWVFKPVEVELIRAAEHGGMLEQVLKQIADYVEHDWEIRRLVSRETMYPKIVLFVALMILGYPGFMGQTMAFVKLVLGGMGNAQGKDYTLLQYLLDTLGFGILCIALFVIPLAIFRLFLFNVKGVREGYDTFKNAVPGFGGLAKMFAVARFSRTLAALYRGGFGMSHALQIAGDASGNAVLRGAVQRAIPHAERGGLVSESLRSSGFFSPMSIDMFRTGETAGRLDEMLDRMADFYEAEGKLKTRQAALIFGTAVFLLVAILVAVQVISFWTGHYAGVSSGGGE
jgi:type II secretory pathway component PulF